MRELFKLKTHHFLLTIITSVSLSSITLPTYADERYIFQIPTNESLMQFKKQLPKSLQSKLKKVQMGLSSQQVSQLKVLTQGEVDFSGIYSVDASEGFFSNSLKKNTHFSSVISKGVPPPVILEDGLSDGPIHEITDEPVDEPTNEIIGDPELAGQWWIEELKVPATWNELQVSGAGVTIADCDAGYYIEESDIRGNLLLEFAYDTSDKDNPTIVNDGNFVSHGTSVVAIMSGVKDDQGTSGIAYDSKVVPLQNFNYSSALDDLGKEEATAQCILHAIEVPEVDIIVLENQTATGSSETFAGTREAVRLAMAAGITIVSAGGNYSVELKAEEEDDTGSIIVGALSDAIHPELGARMIPASFTNFGKRVTVAAYGRGLHTLAGPDGRFTSFGGTSGATPQVAATVAMMLEAKPGLSPLQLRDILAETSIKYDVLTGFVGGKLDVFAAVKKAEETEPDTEAFFKRLLVRQEVVRILQQN